ncbi:MAG: AmpG family muropeptide MFS transporter [Alphaproteobacteria bacterium]|nr:MFS transporter [Alphaproteobacteria bacterium]
MHSWRVAARAYQDPRVLAVLFLGFSSGLPFLLTLATLHVWLLEVGLTKTTLGLFAFATIPYTLKFLWAPFLDKITLPFFGTVFGKRKGWMLASQLCLIISLLTLGASSPSDAPLWTACAAFFVSVCSATQDIVVEAYRIEALETKRAGAGAGASSFGYRLGMWVSGAGALYLASYFSWFCVYAIMAGCVIVGIITTLLTPEPDTPPSTPSLKFNDETNTPFILKPFMALIKRPELSLTLLFIFSYKIGDTVLNTMTIPFLLEIGFSKIEIAHVAKSFGIAAAVFGSLLGGLLLTRWSLVFNLMLCSALQIFASLMFFVQASMGHDLVCLFISIGIENVACGMGTTAYLVYLSSRCARNFTASHFALLCSFGSLCRVCLSFLAGWTADHVTWEEFYLLSAFACLPCFFLLASFSGAFKPLLWRAPKHREG